MVKTVLSHEVPTHCNLHLVLVDSGGFWWVLDGSGWFWWVLVDSAGFC
jgi:hypothetical protein